MIARVGNDLCPRRWRNEWLSPCAVSQLPSVGPETCVSCATRATCIRIHLVRTLRREAVITIFGDHPIGSHSDVVTRRSYPVYPDSRPFDGAKIENSRMFALTTAA